MIKRMTAPEVVETFLGFFEGHGHLRIPGASLVPKNDPSLLFINSGMAPLKPYFLGQETPPAPDLTNVQRCIRTNDIEEVGDRHHLTFFEMMGSWSIGHYWKDRAIALAWELLTQGFGFPPERLYATVYSGDPGQGVPADEESIRHWQAVGMAPDHIVRLGEDNFWGPAGEYGPCGPCTEVFFDTGPEHGPDYVPGGHFDDVGRFIEIWNAGVFMEYNKLPTGLSQLDMRSVDTGSGLERMLMTLNGLESVYETDPLRPLVGYAAQHLGNAAHNDPAARLIADHVRSSVMMLADQVRPGNSGAGYIPRRLIRRAIAAAYQRNRSFDFAELVDIAIANAGGWNPQVGERAEDIRKGFAREREEFEHTLAAGMARLEEAAGAGADIDGATAFRLFSTYGLPVDTIRDYVRQRGGAFDERGFEVAFAEHQEVSRATRGESDQSRRSLAFAELPGTDFVGYRELETEAQIIAIVRGEERVERASAGEEVQIVTDRTSFYAEGGGQVGDRGRIESPDGSGEVCDTSRPFPIVFAHHVRIETGALRVGDRVTLNVDAERRRRVQANHSATHLLHHALRQVLGAEVGQAGSLVDADRLRFDFTYADKVPDSALERVEQIVNEEIRANHPRAERTLPYAEAIEAGAMAFFGDKYGAEVRTIGFGPSLELCGGCHVAATGDIGLLVIQSEGSVARGARRIQALTGGAAFDYLRERERTLARLAARLNAKPEEVEARVEALLAKPRAEPARRPADADALSAQAATLPDGTPAVIGRADVDTKAVRALALDNAKRLGGVAILVVTTESSASVTVAVADALAERWPADAILARLLPLIEGRGGGKATLAAGAGPRLDGVDELLERARHLEPEALAA